MFFKKKKPISDEVVPGAAPGASAKESLFAPGLNPLPTQANFGSSVQAASSIQFAREDVSASIASTPVPAWESQAASELPSDSQTTDVWQAWESGEITVFEQNDVVNNPEVEFAVEPGNAPAQAEPDSDFQEVFPEGVYLASEETDLSAAPPADASDWAAFLKDFSASSLSVDTPSSESLNTASPEAFSPESAWTKPPSSESVELPEFVASESAPPEFELPESALPDAIWSELTLPELPPSEPLSSPSSPSLPEEEASLRWFDEDAIVSRMTTDESLGAASGEDLSHFTENGGTFLDAVNEQLYPDDPFHSAENPDEPPGKTAFEEAARYLFPETMQSPVDWSEMLAVPSVPPSPVGQSHLGVHWPNEVFNTASLELGSSFQTGGSGLMELSADELEPSPELEPLTFDWMEEAPPVASFADIPESQSVEASVPDLEDFPDTRADFVSDFRSALHVAPLSDEASFFEETENPSQPDEPPAPPAEATLPSDEPEMPQDEAEVIPQDEPVWDFSLEEAAFEDAISTAPDVSESVPGPPIENEEFSPPSEEISLPECSPVAASVVAPQPSPAPLSDVLVAPVAKLGRLDIVSVCPLDVDTRLMVVHNGEVYALMAQSGLEDQPRITVLKIFDRNPLAYQSTFAAVPDTRAEREGLYMVQVGVLHGILSLFKDQITWHRDLG